MDKKTNNSAMSRMKQLGIGEVLEFPLERLSSIKNMACVVSVENGIRLRTRIDRERNIVYVSRQDENNESEKESSVSNGTISHNSTTNNETNSNDLEVMHLRSLLEEKNKIIEEKERLIQHLLSKKDIENQTL